MTLAIDKIIAEQRELLALWVEARINIISFNRYSRWERLSEAEDEISFLDEKIQGLVEQREAAYKGEKYDNINS